MSDAPLEPPCGFLEIDDARRLVRVGAHAARWLGYTEQELLGSDASAVFSVPARLLFFANVFPALTQGQLVEEVYLTLKRRDGALLSVVLAATRDDVRRTTCCSFLPMRRRELFENEIVSAQRSAEDSARGEREAREEVRAVEARLAQSERLAALGTLVAGVAHELNNPLAFVSANLDLLAERLEHVDAIWAREPSALVADARGGVARMGALIASMKSLVRSDVETNEPVDLERAIDEGVKMVGVALLARARLDVTLERPLPWVYGHEQRWAQVVTNLIANAAQAFPKADASTQRIAIDVRRADDDPATVRLELRDNGPGIPREIQERIFDPFFTTKPVGIGTGLGLSICHGIVTAAGGTIELESAPGRGTCFRVTMRVAPALTAAPVPNERAPVRASEGEAPPAAVRAVVIDDEPMVAQAVAKTLRIPDTTIVLRGDDARRILASGTFDVIVCDLMMPDVTGIDLYEELRARDPEAAARVVFLSGGSTSAKVRTFLASVPNERVTKPFELAELRAAVQRVVKRAAR